MSINVTNTSINYGDISIIQVLNLTNIIITPNISVINIEIVGNITTITVKPDITTLYYITGYNSFNLFISLNTTIYVKITSLQNKYIIDYNTSLQLNVNGSSTYIWYPSTYLNVTNQSSVICTPLENIIYTILGTDEYYTITRTYIEIIVNSNLIFTPSNPTIYSGNRLLLNVSHNNPNIDNILTYSWQLIPLNCNNIKYGNTIILNPYQNQEYRVTAYNNNDIITVGNIKLNVIVKPSNIIDSDILPYKWYNLIIERNRDELIKEVKFNKVLSFKIINFYYTTLQSAYRMEWTNKNGIPCKINWTTLYEIVNETSDMKLSFEQQWKFFQYIQYNRHSRTQSNFFYLLNIINEIYLENSQKISLYPMEMGSF